MAYTVSVIKADKRILANTHFREYLKYTEQNLLFFIHKNYKL